MRTPKEIIGEDSYMQLVFEGYEVTSCTLSAIPVAESPKVDVSKMEMTTHSDLIRGLEALKKSVPYPDPQDQMYGNCRLANREAEIHNAALDLAAEIVRKQGDAMALARDSLDEILNYTGGANNALEDRYVIDRACEALASIKGETKNG